MDYSLARSLKDAGFPQEPDGLGRWIDKFDQTYSGFAPAEPEDAIIPTLSQLIEACGEKFLGLAKWDLDSGPEKVARWYASTRVKKNTSDLCWGDAPEEAVGNLWLALNEK